MKNARTETVDQQIIKSAPMPVRLMVLEGPDKGRQLEAIDGTVLVGTHGDCQLQLTDPGISRRHLSLELKGSRIRVCDLGSKNGTTYLGAKLEELEVPLGASLELGRETVLALVPIPKEGAISERTILGDMLGQSVAMRRIFALMEQVGPTDAACILTGETGTGKELAARTLHSMSPRANKPFVVVECGALSSSLATATLFGHVRGAFTGAVKDANGLIWSADGGTLFLDEVGSLPLEMQPLLLRVLDSHTFQRVGEGKARTSDFRVISSSREDLNAVVKAGRFRADLYYRLAAITVELPPLRNRFEDLALLTQRFAEKAGAKTALSPEVIAGLAGWHWPGNIRELRNAVESSVILGGAPMNAPAPASGPQQFYEARDRVMASFERSYIQALLQKHHGSVAAVAREAGVGRSQLYRLFEAHGIVPEEFR